MNRATGAGAAAAVLILSLTACGATSAAANRASGREAADANYANRNYSYSTVPDYMLDSRLKGGVSVDGVSKNAADAAAKSSAKSAADAAAGAASDAGRVVRNAATAAGSGMNMNKDARAAAK
jgi:hypothetical protein